MRLSKYTAEGVNMPPELSAKYCWGRKPLCKMLSTQKPPSAITPAHIGEEGMGGRGAEWVGEAQIHV